MNKHKKILITGGGTGGHVIPLESIVSILKNEENDVLYVGSGSKIERDFIKRTNISYKKIMTGKWRRYFDINNFIDLFKVFIGTIQSFFIILFYGPDVVFSKGGYVGLPVVYAAWILGKEIYIHETDSVIGLANKISINKVEKIFVSFPLKYYQDIPASKIVYTGNPIREEYSKIKKKKIFTNNKKTILVTGGSQGARYLNQSIAKILSKLTKQYNVVHICGENDYEWLSQNKWSDYKLFKFTNIFPSLLYNCDLVISRSGGTLFEIAYCKKAAILVPLPTSANNHQYNNAKILEKENAAIVLNERKLSSDGLLEVINLVLGDRKLKQEMENKISLFSNKTAAKDIANYLSK